jgi:hypothetical protein
MSDRLNQDGWNIRKLMRETEAAADETLVACAKLKQAMIVARSNPEVGVGSGQVALLKLTRAEQNFATAYTDLLRVHAELSGIARETAAMDEDIPTEIKGAEMPAERIAA